MKKILIVDDEKNIRISIDKCLRGEGYDTNLCCDGEEALETIKKSKYDLILMDVKMPKSSGIEILKKIREYGITTRVIMMTAYGTVDIAVDAMKLGAIDFISKPFTIKKIKDIVKETLMKDSDVLIVDKTIKEYINKARDAIIKDELDQARIYLKEALVKDTSSAEIQNLLGVLEEKSHNKQLAQKYYRAALSLDATYKPADNNLMRTAMYSPLSKGIDIGNNKE